MKREGGVTLGELARAVGGELEGGGDARAVDVTHDSRQVEAGWLFVAIRGEKSDGNRFVAD
ncbi:MAG TPA: Mur ligase domain-containing protein, partial [Pyrinomonadaceae bacterium]